MKQGKWLCWQCGADLEALPRPYGRLARCPACRADLHVCRMCRHFDPTTAKQCREPMAEAVGDKTRANFCEWFQPRGDAYTGEASRPKTRRELEALFGAGDAGAGEPAPPPSLDESFGP